MSNAHGHGEAPIARMDGAKAERSGYLSSTFRHGFVYLLGTVFSRMASLLLLPVYTRLLTPRDYGVLELLSYTIDVMNFLVGLGIGTSLTRFYYKCESEADRDSLVATASVLLYVLFLLVSVPVLWFSKPIASALLGPREPAEFIQLAMLSILVGVAIEVPMMDMRARQQSNGVVAWGAARLLLAICFNLILVVWFRLGVYGVLVSNLLSGMIVGGLLMGRLLRRTGLRFNRHFAAQLVAFGAPFAVWELGSFVLHFSDRYFLKFYDTLDSVGLYSLSYKIALVIPFFITGPFSSIWLPKALEIQNREGAGAMPILSAIQRHYSLLLIGVALGVALFAADAIRIGVGAEFRDSYRPIPVLALAMVFFGYRQMAQIGVVLKDKPGLVARSTTVAAVTVVLLNWSLIPRWGAMGAAFATLGGFATEFFVMRWYSMREYPLRIGIGVLPLAVAVAVWALTRSMLPTDGPILLSLFLNLIGFALFIGTLMLSGAMDAAQRGFVFRIMSDPRGSLRALRGG